MWPKFYHGCAAPAIKLARQRERSNRRMSFQHGLDSPLQVADPLSVNHTNFEYALLATDLQVSQQDVLYLTRLDRVQVQDAVDWQRHRLAKLILAFPHKSVTRGHY